MQLKWHGESTLLSFFPLPGQPAAHFGHISALMNLFKTKSSSKGSGRTVLERRTAELKEKLARFSFRRHSAPAEQSSRKESECEPFYYGCGLLVPAVSPPLVLSQLPTPILELVLSKISLQVNSNVRSDECFRTPLVVNTPSNAFLVTLLQELVSGAALVHTTWRAIILDESFWRRRLAGKLPQELISCFNRGGFQWTKHAAEFFSKNLLFNPEFDPHRLSVAKGLGEYALPIESWQKRSTAVAKAN